MLSERIKEIQDRVAKAKARSAHRQGQVLILGASKERGMNQIREVAEHGIMDMGENYAQELLMKAPVCLDTKIRWHFIGRLQSNKIKFILPYVSMIHSVDSLELAQKIGRLRLQSPNAHQPLRILIQINQGSERQKSGLSAEVVKQLFSEFLKIEGIHVSGVMSIPPVAKSEAEARRYFKELKQIYDELRQAHKKPEEFSVLSMGMSQDFEAAIEEGSTLVRIGEALFGPRAKKIAAVS